MDSQRVWNRKNLLVAPRFQMSIIVTTVILTMLLTGLFTWSAFYLIWKQSVHSGNLRLIESLLQPGLWLGLGVCMLAGLVITSILLLKLTHRIAGQMYRFEKTLEQVVCGDTVNPVFTRKDDYFHDFEAELNRFITREN